MTKHVYDREKLYQEVWDEPLTKVAPRYEISDVTLRKTCIKLKVPTPERGYWQKIKAGVKINKPRLPKYNGPSLNYYIDPEVYEKHQKEYMIENEEDRKKKERVKLAWGKMQKCKHSIKVFEELTEPHPLVEQWYERLKRDPPKKGNRWAGNFVFFDNESLDIMVSEVSAIRALCIMDAVIKTLVTEGHTVGIDIEGVARHTYVRIGNEKSYFKLSECKMRVPHVKTQEEIQGEKTPHYGFFPRPYDYLPTGKLRMMNEYFPDNKWMDTPEHKLEDCLSDFIDGLMLATVRAKIKREGQPERERRFLEKERIRQEEAEQWRIQQELRAKEVEKFKELKRQATDWHLAQSLKEYIDAMEFSLPEEELATRREYIVWARKRIALLNPLV